MKFEIIKIGDTEYRVSYYYQMERFYGGKWHDYRDSCYRHNRIPCLLADGEKIRVPFSKYTFRVKYLVCVRLEPVYADLFSAFNEEYLYIRKSSRERFAEWSARCSELGLLDLAMVNMRESFEACEDSDQPLRL